MSMDLNFYNVHPTNQRGSPVPGFDLWGYADTKSKNPFAVLSSHCAVRVWNDRHKGLCVHAQPDATLIVSGGIVKKDNPFTAKIRVNLRYEVLKAIEEIRQGKKGVLFELGFSVIGAPIIQTEQHRILGEPDTVQVMVEGQDAFPVGVELSRDAWLKNLGMLGFADIEVFELPTYKRLALPGMQKAIDELRGAEQAMGLGDWSGVMVKTRAAFEAVSSISGGEGADTKTGFKLFWERMFPETRDEEIRKALDGIVDRLAKFQHIGRHKRQPFPEIERPEALLVLRQTLALFEYVGQRMKKAE